MEKGFTVLSGIYIQLLSPISKREQQFWPHENRDDKTIQLITNLNYLNFTPFWKTSFVLNSLYWLSCIFMCIAKFRRQSWELISPEQLLGQYCYYWGNECSLYPYLNHTTLSGQYCDTLKPFSLYTFSCYSYFFFLPSLHRKYAYPLS